MNGPEIQKKIASNMRIVEEEAQKGIFTLSARAAAAVEENKYLRGICPSSYSFLII